MRNPMRILVRPVLNRKFLEMIAKFCATLCAIGCTWKIRTCIFAECIASERRECRLRSLSIQVLVHCISASYIHWIHWVYICTENTVHWVHWVYTDTEGTPTLSVHWHWVHAPCARTHAHLLDVHFFPGKSENRLSLMVWLTNESQSNLYQNCCVIHLKLNWNRSVTSDWFERVICKNGPLCDEWFIWMSVTSDWFECDEWLIWMCERELNWNRSVTSDSFDEWLIWWVIDLNVTSDWFDEWFIWMWRVIDLNVWKRAQLEPLCDEWLIWWVIDLNVTSDWFECDPVISWTSECTKSWRETWNVFTRNMFYVHTSCV